MTKKIETVPTASIPNVSANDPANVSLNEYSKLKVRSDLRKKENLVKKLKHSIDNHDTILEQQKKDLETFTLEIEKLKSLEKMIF